MIRRPTKADFMERNEIWSYVSWRMNEGGITPKELSSKTKLSQEAIERGTRGEPVPVMHALVDLVDAFGLISGRQKSIEDTSDILTSNELKKLLKPPSAMPPRQGNFWDYL